LLDGGPSPAVAQTDPHLAPLVDLATALRSVPLGPTPDFRSALRQRLVAVAGVQGVGEVSLPAAVRDPSTAPSLPARINEWAEGWRVRGRVITATAAASAVVIVGGVGLAGSRSLPGQPFYGIKRGVEQVQLAAAGSTEAKGERHLQFARTRLHEVASLVDSPQALGVRIGSQPMVAGSAFGGSVSSRVISTLRDMDKETTAGTKDLTTAFARSHDSHPLQVLAVFAATQQSKLTAVIPSLPAAAAPQAAESLALIQRVGTRAGALLTAPACTATCGPSAPSASGGAAPAPQPGTDDLGTTPCSCTQPGGSGSEQPGTQPAPAPSPTGTPKPGDNNNPQQPPTTTSPSPTPTKSPSLQDQIGSIISQLPLPVPVPTLPVPVPVPTLPSLPSVPPINLP
jgi:hypothetical protein